MLLFSGHMVCSHIVHSFFKNKNRQPGGVMEIEVRFGHMLGAAFRPGVRKEDFEAIVQALEKVMYCLIMQNTKVFTLFADLVYSPIGHRTCLHSRNGLHLRHGWWAVGAC